MAKKYKVLVGLSVPATEAESKRIVAARQRGKPVPWDERKMIDFLPGQITPKIPEIDVPWMLEQGCIEEVGDDG